MKRKLTLLLALALVLTTVGCGISEKGAAQSNDGTESKTELETESTINTSEDGIDNTESDSSASSSQNPEGDTEENVLLFPEYKMAQIGKDSRVSESKYGIHKTGLEHNQKNKEGITYYALSWVFEEINFVSYSYITPFSFVFKNAKTGEILERSDEHLTWKIYQSTIYDTEYIVSKKWGLDERTLCTFVLYSDYEINYEDIEIWRIFYDSNNEKKEYKLEFNASLEEITTNPTLATGFVLVETNENYMVSDANTTGGGRGGNTNYNQYDFITVKNPFQDDKIQGNYFDKSKISFVSKETLESVTKIPESTLYYDQELGSGEIEISIGIESDNEEVLNSLDTDWYIVYDGCALTR